ncbi:hypothetical protein [Streptomyces sp. NPDC058108]|uniref:hypothetical protein n=1 Tax=Streptomyces sp. NPDC058108 TaxID=3346344 RepID=UPI0036E4B886
MSADITLRKAPGESTSEFIARIVAARPPLTDEEKVALRTIFRPIVQRNSQAHRPAA